MQRHPAMFLRLMRFFLGRRKDRAGDAPTAEETLRTAAKHRKREGASASPKAKSKQPEKAAS